MPKDPIWFWPWPWDPLCHCGNLKAQPAANPLLGTPLDLGTAQPLPLRAVDTQH